MSTSPRLPTVPRINNPEYPSVRWGRTVRSAARLGLNNGRSSRGCVIDTSLCLLIAEWADVALAILERRAAEQPCRPWRRRSSRTTAGSATFSATVKWCGAESPSHLPRELRKESPS